MQEVAVERFDVEDLGMLGWYCWSLSRGIKLAASLYSLVTIPGEFGVLGALTSTA